MQTERNINEDRISQAAACHTEQRRLRALYPWAVPGQVSKNAKKFLGEKFPGVKFSVTLDRATGESELRVRWDLGPTPQEVEAVIEPFRAGRWNLYTEEFEYTHGPERQAWSAVMGDVKFFTVSRSWLGTFAPLKTARVTREIAEQLPKLASHWFEGQDKLGVWNEAFRLAETIVYRTSFPAWFDGTTPWRLERVTDGEGKLVSGVSFEETWRIVLDETCAPVPAVPGVIRIDGNSSVSVTENPAKNGVEVRFAVKPAPETLESLKRAGFRWSKFQSLWYARRSPETLAFAHALLPS